jgi:hypothetical protein
MYIKFALKDDRYYYLQGAIMNGLNCNGDKFEKKNVDLLQKSRGRKSK